MGDTVELKKRAKGARPTFFDDPTCDRLLAIVTALAGEVAVLRDRLDSLERVAERSGAIGPGEVEAYRPDAAGRAARDAWREAFLSRVLRIVHADREADADDTPENYERAVEELARR